MSPATTPWPSRTSRSPTIPPWTKPRRSRRAARCRHRAPASRSPSTRTSTTGRARSPRRAAFTVKANGVDVTVQSVHGGQRGRTVPPAIWATDAIKQGQTVTVDYAVPATGLRSLRTPPATRPWASPTLRSTTIPRGRNPAGSGERRGAGSKATLNLTFNEDLDIGPVHGSPGQRLHRQGRRRRGDGAIRAGLLRSGHLALILPPPRSVRARS